MIPRMSVKLLLEALTLPTMLTKVPKRPIVEESTEVKKNLGVVGRLPGLGVDVVAIEALNAWLTSFRCRL